MKPSDTSTPRESSPHRKRRSYSSDRDGKQNIPRRRSFSTTKRSDGERGRTHRNEANKKSPSRRNTLRTPLKKRYIHTELSQEHLSVSKKIIGRIPPIEEGAVRVLVFGGVEEVGRNMTALETKDSIIIIDCGMLFSDETLPGISAILPNIQYLEENKHKIKALVVTHGHLDHIGGIVFLTERLGNPPIYSRAYTNLIIKRRQGESIDAKPLEYNDVDSDSVIQIGDFVVRFFVVTHTIPDTTGIIVETPLGGVVFSGDVKVDHDGEGNPSSHEIKEWGQFNKNNPVLFLSDSTNAPQQGFSLPEWKVWENIDEIIRTSKSRLIFGTFASQVERIVKLVESVERHGRKIVVDGMSMKNSIAIAKEIGYIKAKDGTFITFEEMDKYPDEKLLILVTGAQGDKYAVLDRIGKKIHRHITLKETDVIVLSSSVIPGNELPVQRIKDNLTRQGAHIITYRVSDIHASGHANEEELKWVLGQVSPRFFVPIHGHHFMLRAHADIAEKCGMKREDIFIPDNGSVFELKKDEKGSDVLMKRLSHSMPTAPTVVDGVLIGHIQDVVIRDRQMLAEDGIFSTIIIIRQRTKKLMKSPDIISRGFVYLRESQRLLQDCRSLIKRTVEQSIQNQHPINIDSVKRAVTREVEGYLFQKTLKRPLVIPTIFII